MAADEQPQGPQDPRWQRAEQAVRSALAIEPQRNAFWNTLGVALQRQERWAEAEVAYRRATELSLERTEPFFSRAQALQRLGRSSEVGPMFERLLAARPRDVGLRLQLVNLSVQSNDLPAAAGLLRQVLAIEPTHAQAVAALAEIEARLRR